MTEVRIPTPAEIRALRKRLGLTQAEAAERIGVARKTWMYYESPTRGERPSQRVARLIALLAKGRI